ncbi:DNA polymerase III subunit gamma/tau [Trichococcus pasteurii]|uniref:DNA-directed DNA polymerase n=1 Tax=Trichococcus pasteurii TaxID=43064 RepID=A0A1W1IH55_9LACT|nr:DNA polymerase III subunit gamma/tau [Trichococcus pasteurii]SFE89633.1 DNA polymerase-3 subunit gamma/tau [Trichococcus pasteurii]SLM52300.1 dna polymerase iii delta subunit [Trichococcus pasteurii]SSB93181.1 dna polymerase iii delta subunit [Trichococcus pasteurii]
MSYQALYRVWRPQRFGDIAGQEAVTQTLKNALIQGKTSHAYLFTGPRGTGKTSAAKIFAKAINCHHRVDGEPCNECETCRAITEGRLNDVIEIDAASNNGVEEIRDIRDKARYAPTQADYKVYIIDEVHMLSTGAFNALLKTLEEPPENVIFILATTEPHKIPLTIISRTQRFDFKRISYQDIINRMAYILQEEKISYDDQALHVIARSANGGMRDALSLLDQVISYGSESVTFDNAVKVSGSLTEEMMISFSGALLHEETETALQLLQEILSAGKEAGRFLEEMILFARDVLVYQQTKGKAFADNTQQYSEAFQTFSQEAPATFLYEMIEAFNQTQGEMRFSTQPDIYLEVLAVKLSQPHAQATATAAVPSTQTAPSGEVQRLAHELELVKKELAKLQELIASGNLTVSQEGAKAAPAKKETARQSNTSAGFKPNMGRTYQILGEATKQDLARVRDFWTDILDVLSVTQRAVLKQANPVAASPTSFILAFQYDILCQKATEDAELQAAVDAATQRMLQRPGELVCLTEEQWTSVRRNFIQNRNGSPAAGSDGEPKQAAPKPTAQPAAPKQQAATTVDETAAADLDLPPEPPMPEMEDGFRGDYHPGNFADDFAVETDPIVIEEQKEQEVVDQALSLFGDEVVTVVED